MKKNIIVAVAAVATLGFQSCHKTFGDGPAISRTYNVTGFTSIDAGLDGDVHFTQDSVYKVEIYAQSNVHDLIETPVENGELRLQFKKYSKLGRHDKVVVYVSAPTINGLGVNGSGTVMTDKPIGADYITLKVNGSGTLNVTSLTAQYLTARISGSGSINVNGGTATSSDLNISGSGDIDMLNLAAKSVKTTTSGSGNTTVRVSDFLDVRISGSGDVYYLGNPSINTSISGSGKVTRL